jgi:beta-ribofuranosylaminobenzene 5'-phosphate synthase
MARVRVSTGNRLHFGLLRLPLTPDWADDGTWYFGGAGLMISEPGVSVVVQAADQWGARGERAARALNAGQRFAAATGQQDRFAISVERCPLEHVGLGVGTQLELAVGTAIAQIVGHKANVQELASVMRRGRRSGVGVLGFAQGGFLIDEGKRRPGEPSVVRRHAFPENWCLLLMTPASTSRWHGIREEAAFATLGAQSVDRMEALLRFSIEPALIAHDIRTFGSALTEYNALAGECFRNVQLGRYASPFIEEAISWLREQGAAAAGQSSWGPTVFSIWDDIAKRRSVQEEAKSRWGTDVNVWATSAANHGAAVSAD